MRFGGGSACEVALYSPLVPSLCVPEGANKSKDHKTLNTFGSEQGLVRG